LNQIKQHQIQIYEFPDCDEEEENKVNKQMRERVPFAVVGSNTVVEVDGKKARGRKYPWGTVLGTFDCLIYTILFIQLNNPYFL
jgi:septin 7